MLNDINIGLTEKQVMAGILDEEIQRLEKLRHTKAKTEQLQKTTLKQKPWVRHGVGQGKTRSHVTSSTF